MERKTEKEQAVNHWREPFVYSGVTFFFLWRVFTRSHVFAAERSQPLLSVFWGLSIRNPAFHLSASKGLKSQQREPSSHRQHVPCYCHLSLHAVDSAEYCCRVRRAHCLHEHRLARWIPPCIRCSFRPPWGHHSRRGLQAHFRHLWSLYKTASTAGNTVWTVRSPLWRDCQRVLAGYFYLPGCRDPVAVCRGIHFRLHHVLSKHHEEEHL